MAALRISYLTFCLMRSWDIVVIRMVTRLRGGRKCLKSRKWQEIFSFLLNFQTIFWASFQGVKRPESGVQYSPPSITEVQNVWSYISTFHITFGNVHKEIFTMFRACFGLREIHENFKTH
jgi:hypothetical protein